MHRGDYHHPSSTAVFGVILAVLGACVITFSVLNIAIDKQNTPKEELTPTVWIHKVHMNDPFRGEIESSKVYVYEIRDGWVKYKLNDGWQYESMELELFTQLYIQNF